MKLNYFLKCSVIGALMFTPAAPVVAGDLGAGIVGAIVGGAIVHNAHKNKSKRKYTRKTTRKSSVSTAQRAENRMVQTSLNYFSFPVGAADGALGRKSRAAISDYQVFLGYPPTGQLTQYEKDFLLGSYHRAIAGGAMTHQVIASSPHGPKGLLLQYRDQAAGLSQTAQAPLVETPTPEANALAALPTFGASAAPELSLASHCNTVSLMTNVNGGYVTQVSSDNALLAMNEQFCLARSLSIAESEMLMGTVQGFTQAQMQQQCETFGPAMKEYVTGVSLKDRSAVTADVSGFILNSGMPPAQLTNTAKICLGIGYRVDNMDVALSSTLLLVALGSAPYGELLGHHLAQGFGATKRVDLATQWYASAIDALDAGAEPVFATNQPSRTTLLQEASVQLGGGAIQAQAKPATGFVLPTFDTTSN